MKGKTKAWQPAPHFSHVLVKQHTLIEIPQTNCTYVKISLFLIVDKMLTTVSVPINKYCVYQSLIPRTLCHTTLKT